ncbi:MAG TPA: ATP-binding cassette domain-containing protein [Jiangellales bacterium]|nr:ATP-binding cassette domain-containing protein [Jiangellales bacterium]
MIEIHGLTKRYGDRTVVDDVSFACRPGTVTGFLGPNGAGKSTTLRMICGLTPPSAGTATVAGRPYRDLPNPGRRVGVLLDASAHHPGRTGRETLSLSAMTIGADQSRVPGLLDLVGLDATAGRKRVRAYSLGMRQRLGIAMALVGDPEVLILDEPANGLDPEGVAWMRRLLRGFADRGGTVLLSSHLLTEVEALADRIVVIRSGRIVADGDKDTLLAGTGTLVRAQDLDRLGRALRDGGFEPAPTADGALLVSASLEDVARLAAAAGVVPTELRAANGNRLEQLFFNLVDPAAGATS